VIRSITAIPHAIKFRFIFYISLSSKIAVLWMFFLGI
jgi:hypothetical protein